jgi:hypothetical protein
MLHVCNTQNRYSNNAVTEEFSASSSLLSSHHCAERDFDSNRSSIMHSAAPMHTVVQDDEQNADKCATFLHTGECGSLFTRNRHTSPEAQRAAALHMFVVKLQSTLQHNAQRTAQEAFRSWRYASTKYKERSADVSIQSASLEDVPGAVMAAQSVEHRSSATGVANSPPATSSTAAESRRVSPLEKANDQQLQLVYTTAATAQSTASSGELEAAEFQCLICMEHNQMNNMYTVACGHADHTYCVDCMAQHCGTQLLDMGCMPRCPGRDCNSELTRAQLTAIWAVSEHIAITYFMHKVFLSDVVSVRSAIANMFKLFEL